jgi:hypothetical protein
MTLMSRLDRHIQTVRNKLALGTFLRTWGWAILILGAAVWLVVLGQKTLDRALPHRWAMFWIGLAAATACAMAWTLVRRPSPAAAAIAIDQALGLKEKFSTALYVRPSADPFAKAVVLDAQNTAQSVSLYKRFPLQFPRPAAAAAAMFLAAMLTAQLMPTMHLWGKTVDNPLAAPKPAVQTSQEPWLRDQLPKIEQGTKLLSNNDEIRRAADELDRAAKTKEGDELHARRSTLSALQDYQKAMKQELEKNQDFQTAQGTRQQLAELSGAQDQSTPVGKAHNELKAGDLDAAMSDLAKAVNDFDKLSPQQQEKMIQQAQRMAQDLARAGHDPKVAQKITQQLLQMGATQAQAQRMAAAMQQAAAGDKQAAQQLQQMAQQMAQQMNNGQGPTPQQQRIIQQMMARSQGLANSQAQASALASSSQQLAAAMSQCHSGAPGQKPGQGQAMSQASANLQQQLQQMQAQAKDAAAMKAAADAAAQSAADAAAGLNPTSPAGAGGQESGSGQDATGQAHAGQGPGGPGGAGGAGQNPGGGPGRGHGGGKNPDMAETPFHMRQELDPSKDISSGRTLASRYVKAGIDPGQSEAALRDAAAAAEKDAPDEIEQDHISRDAQETVKDYFTTIQKQQGQ